MINNEKSKNNSENFKFVNEKIILNEIDYYYSNVIARSSKTMSRCRQEKMKLKETSKTNPRNTYAKLKLKSENYIKRNYKKLK